MNSAIPYAYSQLLLAIKEMNSSAKSHLQIDRYCFHSLWPLRVQLEAVNPWDIFIDELYKLISAQALFFSQSQNQWLFLSDCSFVSEEVFSSLSPACKPPKCVVRALEILKQPIVNLPTDFYLHLSNLTFITETQFIRFFLSYITLLLYTSC